MGDKITTRWRRWDGTEEVKEYNAIIDIRDFAETAVYPWLVMAANKGKTAHDISLFLGEGITQRPEHWIHKRRWMVRKRGTKAYRGGVADRNGDYGRAVDIMRANPDLSLRDLARLLRERGIQRQREWVRRHRCD